jgi:serine/threonine protein kinase
MGQGAFGCVAAGEDLQTGAKVAIKKVKNCTGDRTGAKRLLRELRFLRELAGHANIVSLQDVHMRSADGQVDTYIVTDLMEADLEQIIKSSQGLSTEHVRCLTFQMLNGLRHMHRSGIVHRDLKPANCVVDSQCRLKICDLGLSRHISDNYTQSEAVDSRFTDYVVTRWYRAPELLLGCRRYSSKIDMWAAGCILGELITRKPLFPGSDTSDMLVKLCAKLSPPTESQLDQLTHDPAAKAFVRAIPIRAPFSFAVAHPQADPEALNLLEALLQWVPSVRFSVDEALQHPFMAALNEAPAEVNMSSHDELSLVSQRGLNMDLVVELITLEAAHSRVAGQHMLVQSHRPALVAHARGALHRCSCGSAFTSPSALLAHLDPAYDPQHQQQHAAKKTKQSPTMCRPPLVQQQCGTSAGTAGQENVTMMDTYIVL